MAGVHEPEHRYDKDLWKDLCLVLSWLKYVIQATPAQFVSELVFSKNKWLIFGLDDRVRVANIPHKIIDNLRHDWRYVEFKLHGIIAGKLNRVASRLLHHMFHSRLVLENV